MMTGFAICSLKVLPLIMVKRPNDTFKSTHSYCYSITHFILIYYSDFVMFVNSNS